MVWLMPMTLTFIQLGDAALVVVLCIALGSLPLVGWIVGYATGKNLSQQGTGNVSVAAAFQQVGVPVGILAALAEAAKGITAVLLARLLMPPAAYWELVALVGVVIGRYRYGGAAGSTNVFWGLLVHAPLVTAGTAAVGGLGFALVRRPRFWQYAVLVLFCGTMAGLHRDEPGQVVGAIALSLVLAWVYSHLPNDITQAAPQSLDQPLDADQVGQKAATLSELKRAGYPVAEGWAVPKVQDWQLSLGGLRPSRDHPLIVRSSAVGEDQLGASAAGQYETIAEVTSQDALIRAVEQCFVSYEDPAAVRYRQDQGVEDAAMAALVQQQIPGAYSGVAFSRDPVMQQPRICLVEGLPGGADQVVSGAVTPEQYRVTVAAEKPPGALDTSNLEVAGEGKLPQLVVQQAALLARRVERYYHGIPQDIEWSYDGENMWLLQARPITTLMPIWTRKIAMEVIPGVIRPLTWSINQPITCGVWGDIFTVMLGEQAVDLDFDQTATLHYARAYFNASLIGNIFERLGLPPESLEFLTLGESFSPPSPLTVVSNLLGLGRLLRRELQLERHFQRDNQDHFQPQLSRLGEQSLQKLSPLDLQRHIEAVLGVFAEITYYNILAPLSVSIRQALLAVEADQLDFSQTPEVAALRSLQSLAYETRQTFESTGKLTELETVLETDSPASLLTFLAEDVEGAAMLQRLHRIIEKYGYLSESATDIAIPTWRENPKPAHSLFKQFVANPPDASPSSPRQGWLAEQVQRRVQLRGQVAEIYNRTLAELRRSFLALAAHWHQRARLEQSQDIFLLTWDELQEAIQQTIDWPDLHRRIHRRQSELKAYQELPEVPPIIYGNQAPQPESLSEDISDSEGQLQGIGASAGQVEGRIKVISDWQRLPPIDRQTILTVPYTDAGWAPLLAQAGGLISEVGGRLSHGAIVAREYGIPAVMNLSQATQRLRDGQWVRLHGQSGLVELLQQGDSKTQTSEGNLP